MIRRYMDGIISSNQVIPIIYYGANAATDFYLLNTVKAKKDGVDPIASDYISTDDFTFVDYYSYDVDKPFIPGFTVVPAASSMLTVRTEYNKALGICLYKLSINGNDYVFGIANTGIFYIQDYIASLGCGCFVYGSTSGISGIRPTIIV